MVRIKQQLTRREFIAGSGGALLAASSLATAAPNLEKLDLFRAGEGGYALYRIPGIVVTKRGSVLVWCEARKRSGSDWGAIDILMRRGRDGGRTFDGPRVIAAVAGPKRKNPVALAQKLAATDEVTYNNPVMIADRSGAVHFLFCLEYMRCFYTRSDDDGQTFSPPVEITGTFDQFRPEYDWRVLATGPGHGLQLKRGRLIVPVWLSDGTGGHAHRPSVNATIYSDDHGRTWRRGAIVIPNTPEWVNPSEAVVVELSDGRVLFNSRSESMANRRLIAYSQDGATNWTKPVFHDELVEPVCLASMVMYSEKPSRLLFVNPNNLTRADGRDTPGLGRDRKNVSVRLSYDDGRTWPLTRTLEPGPSGYSDIAVGRDGTILCFYENGTKDRSNPYSAQLTLARFSLEWLTGGQNSNRMLPPLPQPSGGQMAGVSNHALLVIGGSYFDKPIWEGGTKLWLDTVHALESGAREWKPAGRLAHPLAYGAGVTATDGVIVIGGSDGTHHYADVFKLRYAGGKLEQTALPALPQPVANCGAALLNNVIYVTGGQTLPSSTEALKVLWALDLNEREPRWTTLEPPPGAGRILPVVAAQAGALYVISGAELVAETDGAAARRYLNDGWKYRPGKGWARIADAPRAAVAAAALGHGKSLLLVFSGDDGANVHRVRELRDKHPGFSRDVLAYDTGKNIWTTVANMPVSLVTTAAVKWQNDIVIPGGEDRPSHRSSSVLMLRLKK